MQPYGRIVDITAPTPVPAGTLRSSTVFFYNVRSAAIARNVIHGEALSSEDGKITRLALGFERPLKAHAIRDWIAGHPRIVVPVVVFLFGTLTYTVHCFVSIPRSWLMLRRYLILFALLPFRPR